MIRDRSGSSCCQQAIVRVPKCHGMARAASGTDVTTGPNDVYLNLPSDQVVREKQWLLGGDPRRRAAFILERRATEAKKSWVRACHLQYAP